MKLTIKITRIVLGLLLITLGGIGLIDFMQNGYDPNNKDLLLFSKEFVNLHNALMQSYLLILVRALLVVTGILLLSKKYWFIGLLMYLPIAVNILAIHLLYDIPPAHIPFFIIAMLVSWPALFLFVMEIKKMKKLLIK